MYNLIKNDFLKQAEIEINNRISHTNDICNKFSRFKGSSNAKQIALLVLCGIFISVILYTIINSGKIINIFSQNNYQRDLILFIISLIFIFGYIILHIINRVKHVLRIANIDNYINDVRKIENNLKNKINNLSKITTDTENIIFSNKKEKIISSEDLDNDILNYEKIVNAYTNPKNNILNLALTIFHWVSGLFFVGVFFFISTSFFSNQIIRLIKINEYSIISYAYLIFFMFFFIQFQDLFSHESITNIHKNIKKIMSIAFIIIGVLSFYFIFVEKMNFLVIHHRIYINNFISLLIYLIPLLLLTGFSSLMLMNNRNYNFNIGYAFLGKICNLFLSILVCLFVIAVCKADNIYNRTTHNTLAVLIVLSALFGFFWNGFRKTRNKFSLHFTYMSLRILPILFLIPTILLAIILYNVIPEAGIGAIIVTYISLIIAYFLDKDKIILRIILLLISIFCAIIITHDFIDVNGYILNPGNAYHYRNMTGVLIIEKNVTVLTGGIITCICHVITCVLAFIFSRD